VARVSRPVPSAQAEETPAGTAAGQFGNSNSSVGVPVDMSGVLAGKNCRFGGCGLVPQSGRVFGRECGRLTGQ